jgi:hypothetical protein
MMRLQKSHLVKNHRDTWQLMEAGKTAAKAGETHFAAQKEAAARYGKLIRKHRSTRLERQIVEKPSFRSKNVPTVPDQPRGNKNSTLSMRFSETSRPEG